MTAANFYYRLLPQSRCLLLITSENKAAYSPNFRFILPDNETTFVVGENVPLRIFTKTQFPRLRVNFKANGQLIGTATSFPYQINWIPAQTGNYNLTAEVSTQQTNAVVGANVQVFNLLCDTIGRRDNRFYNVENSYRSYQSTAIPEANSYLFPMNFLGTLTTPRIIRRIEIILSATSGITNQRTDMPFPNLRSVMARFWNNGAAGFQNSPLAGNTDDLNLGQPNYGSTNVPFAVSSAGISFYLTGWQNLNIPLPASNQLAMSLQFAIGSPYDFTEFISIAESNFSAQNLFQASGRFSPPSTNISGISATALKIWTD